MFDQFHFFASLPRSFSSNFFTLIVKVEFHTQLGYFWPISLMVYLYKFLAKVLVAKLYKGMDKLVSPNQPSFFKWRLLVNEVVFTKKIKKSLIFKVVFEIKYDLLIWSFFFLHYLLIKFSFKVKWNHKCVLLCFSKSCSVGEQFINPKNHHLSEIKQDIITLFPFLLMAEGQWYFYLSYTIKPFLQFWGWIPQIWWSLIFTIR